MVPAEAADKRLECLPVSHGGPRMLGVQLNRSLPSVSQKGEREWLMEQVAPL